MSSVLETSAPQIFSIPLDSMSSEEIENVISLLRAELIVRKSKMTQKEADEIAAEINRSWWKKNQDRIEAMIREHESANRG